MSPDPTSSPPPEFNPLKYPPCDCLRCRCARNDQGSQPGKSDYDGEGSPLLRHLRAQVTAENGLRRSLRRPPP